MMRGANATAAKISARLRATSVDLKMPGEIGVHFGFWEADDFGSEFDKRQAALPHEIVNRPPADVQTPGDLRLGFVVRRHGDLIRF